MTHLGADKKTNRSSVLTTVTEAFEEHSGHLRAFLTRFMRRPQDIDDIAQEAFLRAFKVEQDSRVEHPKTLLFSIAKNIALNELRSKARQVTDYIEECQSEPETLAATLEEEIEGMEQLHRYCEAVDALPEQCRRVYLLRKVHGLPHKEIASRLNITVRSVERHLQKGAIKCRAYMRNTQIAAPKMQSGSGLGRLQKERVE